MSDPQHAKIVYEPPDDDRPASATPTEPLLEQQTPAGRDAAAHDPYAALRNRHFRFLASGFFITVIAAQMQTVAAQYEIYARTGSALSLGVLGGVLAVPMLLLALPAGALADAFSRRKIVLGMLCCNGLLALGLAGLSFACADWPTRTWVTAMYLLLGLGNAAATIGRPARTSLLPQLVPPRIFSNAVTWNSSIFETASMLGPAIGGFVVARSITGAYLLASVCWFACCLFVYALPDIKPPPRQRSGSRLADLFVGLRFVGKTRLMLGAMTLDLFAVLFGGATFLFPVFARDILHVGPTGFGWLRAAPAIGAFAMALTIAHRPPIQRAGRALLLAVTGFGVATIVFGLSKNFWLSFAMLIATGMCDNISVVVRHTLVQMLTPDSMRGRVSAVNQIFIGSSNEIGGLESGLTAQWFGPVISVVGGGVGTLLVVGTVGAIFPEIRKLGSLRDIRPERLEASEPQDLPATPVAK